MWINQRRINQFLDWKLYKMLYFPKILWYNYPMDKKNFQTSNAEMVTISRAEYEEKNARLTSQDERISRLESQVALLTEALRLANHKRFGASSEKSEEALVEQLSFLFNEAEVFAGTTEAE